MVKLTASGEQRALDDRELMAFFNLLITGGVETTSNAISGGMHVLLSHPEQYRALKADFDGLADNAVEEILRYTSPVHFNRRTASEDVDYCGNAIKRGDKRFRYPPLPGSGAGPDGNPYYSARVHPQVRRL